jgi:hypothetical protein
MLWLVCSVKLHLFVVLGILVVRTVSNYHCFTFCFTEVGKGYITPWDLERMATINDFTWTDYEISKMIRCFDSDGDGKVCLCFQSNENIRVFLQNPLWKSRTSLVSARCHLLKHSPALRTRQNWHLLSPCNAPSKKNRLDVVSPQAWLNDAQKCVCYCKHIAICKLHLVSVFLFSPKRHPLVWFMN